MFRGRMPQLVKELDAISCSMEAFAIQTKFKTGSMLFADILHNKHAASPTHYNPQRTLAMHQSQLSRLNR
ncbi:MAG TPA: hypothetical protein VLV18_10555 [Terriglobales bacterium]|nr:hypothetical protein [Terriglobales bacterium]